MRLLLFFITPLIFAGAFSVRADESFGSLLDRLTDLSRLSDFRNFKVVQFSSYDRQGKNKDYSQYLNDASSDSFGLMADVKGPGAIVRIWSANPNIQQAIKIVIDGNPIIDRPLKDFFSGSDLPFQSPLSFLSSGGGVSYLPIPFNKSCKVFISDRAVLKGFFYQVDVLRFDPSIQVQPLKLPLSDLDSERLLSLKKSWEFSAENPDLWIGSYEISIPPHSESEIVNLLGSGKVTSIAITKENQQNWEQISELQFKANFDGQKLEQVHAPLELLFGNLNSKDDYKTLLSQKIGDEARINFPMPYGKNAKFSIFNPLDVAITLSLKIEVKPQAFDRNRDAYFHAQFFSEEPKKNKSHAWLNLENAHGHIVGISQKMNSRRGLEFLEGNEQIQTDDSLWIGTGTEDYFNSGWYFLNGNVYKPTHGVNIDSQGSVANVTAFRWHLLDAPVFLKLIHAAIEHGPYNNIQGTTYSSVTFWYSDH